MEENPFIGFLTKRGFILSEELYVKEGLSQQYRVTTKETHDWLDCAVVNPDGSIDSWTRGQPKSNQTFDEGEMERELVKHGMVFFTQAELDRLCPFCHLLSTPILMSDGGSNYCPNCGPWHRCQDGPVQGSPGPTLCPKCHPKGLSSSQSRDDGSVWGDHSSDFDSDPSVPHSDHPHSDHSHSDHSNVSILCCACRCEQTPGNYMFMCEVCDSAYMCSKCMRNFLHEHPLIRCKDL
jgi:hypothetical protein